jgi:hypothetical protein
MAKTAATSTGFWKGFSNGFLSLLGLGSLYDPLAEKREKLNQSINNFNNYVTEAAYQGLVQSEKLQQDTVNLIVAKGNEAKKRLELVQTDTINSIENINLFILFLYILVFIVCFYLIVRT